MKKHISNKNGYAMATVLSIMGLIGVAFAVLLKSGGQSIQSTKILRDRAKAIVYAEAGIEFAYSILADSYTNRNNPSVFRLDTNLTYNPGEPIYSAYGDGGFNLSLTNFGAGEYVLINSIGVCGNSRQEVEVLIRDDDFNNLPPQNISSNTTNYADMDIFNKVLASGGDVDLTGGGKLLIGNEFVVIANNDITIKGNIDVPCSISSAGSIDTGNKNNKIAGTVTAETVTGKGSVDEIVRESVPPIVIPDFTDDLAKYEEYAKEMGTKDGNVYKVTDEVGEIWYIDNKDGPTFEIKENVNATIIAEGDVTIYASVQETHGFAIATISGDVRYQAQASTVGTIYTYTGSVTQVGGGRKGDDNIIGQIIAGGDIIKGGGGDLAFRKYLPVPPTDEDWNNSQPSNSEGTPVIAAWQK